MILILSGNLSFLNWLSILPALWCLDDAFFRSVGMLSKRNVERITSSVRSTPTSSCGWSGIINIGSRIYRLLVSLALLVGLGYLSIPVVSNLLQLHGRQAMNTNYNNFKLLNTYGVRLWCQGEHLCMYIYMYGHMYVWVLSVPTYLPTRVLTYCTYVRTYGA